MTAFSGRAWTLSPGSANSQEWQQCALTVVVWQLMQLLPQMAMLWHREALAYTNDSIMQDLCNTVLQRHAA